MSFYSRQQGLKGTVGESSAYTDDKEIEMIYCPEIGNEGKKPNLPKAACEQRQQNRYQPICYGGCKAVKRKPGSLSPPSRTRLKIEALLKTNPQISAKEAAKYADCSQPLARLYIKKTFKKWEKEIDGK